MNSLGWHTVVATPPRTIQGLITVWPPVTEVPASSDASLNPWMTRGMTLSRSYKTHTQTHNVISVLDACVIIFNPVKPDKIFIFLFFYRTAYWTFGRNVQTNVFFVVLLFLKYHIWYIRLYGSYSMI